MLRRKQQGTRAAGKYKEIMTTAIGTSEKRETARPGTPLTWVLSLVACAYCLWIGATLFYSTPIFIKMYVSMGVGLPPSTRIIMSLYWVLYPLLFGGTAALVIVKQYFVHDKWANVSAILCTVLVANIVSNAIGMALYRPMWDLMEKLNK
jgi:hypothetical protein